MKRQLLIGLAVTLSLFAHGVCSADEEEEELEPTTIEELEAAIAELIAEREVPAVGITLVDETGPILITAIGKADLEADIDVDADSMFRIGSTSKMFVALSVLKLVEEGRLSLDDKVSELAPEIEFENQWESTDPVRIVHLLEHTTGWDDIHLPEYGHNDPTPITLKEGLDFHPHSRVSRWVPGSRYSYCNAGPPVAAYIVGKITGMDFEGYVQENFFAPMGMETMTYRLSADVEAKGVTLYDNGNTPQPYWHISVRPSGSINASTNDMFRMISFFVNRGAVDGEQLVSTASLERMERVASTPAAAAGQEIGYGLHNYSSTHEGWVYRSHNGGVNGGLTELAYLPEQKLGYVFMINSGDGRTFGDISDLIRNYQIRDLEPPDIAEGETIGDAHRAIEGLYYPVNSRQQVRYFLDRVLGAQKIWFEGSQLKRKSLLDSDVTSYGAASPTAYRSDETGLISLTLVTDPTAGAVVHEGFQVLKPASAILIYGQLAVVALWGLSIAISLLFLLVWGVRRLRGKIAPGAAIRVRVWPLMAGLSIIFFVWMFSLGMSDPFTTLAGPTLISVALMLATIAFAVFAVAGVNAAVSYRAADINRVAYWFSATSSGLHLIVALYFLSFGVIGMMTWA
jgi:CubicO group peptidase (beta-lactamase class C family)